MREQLTDIVRQIAPLFKNVKISGDDTSTRIDGVDEEHVLFLLANLKEPITEFAGAFGLGSLPMLSGLLNHATYKAEGATLAVHRNEAQNHVNEFEFREKRGGIIQFKTMNPRLIEVGQISTIPWHVVIKPTKSSIAELTSFAGLLAEVNTMFGVIVDNETLFITIGDGSSATHTAKIAFATDVQTKYKSAGATYNIRALLSVLKNAGSNPIEIKLSENGIASVSIETDYGIYNYYLRASKPV